MIHYVKQPKHILMKYVLTSIILLSSIAAFTQDVVGTYQLHSTSTDSDDFELKRILTLRADGTFEYYNYRKVERGIPPETHTYGKGSWKRESKVIMFTSGASDIDDKFTLDFSGTKARFIAKSPRDKSDRVIKTALSFYDSEIFWVTGMKLIKTD